jgi:hypothetical protein
MRSKIDQPFRKRDAKASARREINSLACLSVFDGQKCLGFLLPRGRQGVEAYDVNNVSLGIYRDQKSAADAVSGAAATASMRRQVEATK